MSEELKPFQRVLVRDFDHNEWHINFFEQKCADYFICLVGHWKKCLPYNDETAHLLGTTDSPVLPKAMFEWGEHVEVRDYSDEDWKPAIFLFQTPDKVWQFHAILKDAVVANGYAQCRHADW